METCKEQPQREHMKPREAVRSIVRFYQADRIQQCRILRPAIPYAVIGFVISGKTRLLLPGDDDTYNTQQAFVVGPLTVGRILEVSDGSFLVGAMLNAGALRCLFDVPANRLADRKTDLRDLLPKTEISMLQETLTPCMSLKQATHSFSLWLERQIKISSPPFYIPESMWELPGSLIASRLNISIRHYQRLLLEHFGVNSRQLRRYARFLTTLRRLTQESHAKPDLASLALLAGYYDQPHMARDFRELLGQAPIHLIKPHDLDSLRFVSKDIVEIGSLGHQIEE